MKVLCIIPARKGSKAIKNKNILKIKGKYLFAYSIEFAKKLKFLDKIIFSSDSKSYIKKAKKFDSIFFNLRPKSIMTRRRIVPNCPPLNLFFHRMANKNIGKT